MKIAYIAFDGSQFKTKKECEEYESNVNIRFFNAKGDEIPFEQTSWPTFIFISNYNSSMDYFKIKIHEWEEKCGEEIFYSDDFFRPGLYIRSNENRFYFYNRPEANMAEKILKEVF